MKVNISIYIISLIMCTNISYAASLRVSPAMINCQNIQYGITYDIYKETGVRFTIYNDDLENKTWQLAIYPPSERGQSTKDYMDILSDTWCRLDKTTVTVKPNSFEHVYLYIQFPEELPNTTQYHKWM
ncbi:MAG: hypothetical protein OMM_11602, partial [Candidatus Magnetoglobus multicellularis str. Araruama]